MLSWQVLTTQSLRIPDLIVDGSLDAGTEEAETEEAETGAAAPVLTTVAAGLRARTTGGGGRPRPARTTPGGTTAAGAGATRPGGGNTRPADTEQEEDLNPADKSRLSIQKLTPNHSLLSKSNSFCHFFVSKCGCKINVIFY